MERTIHFTLVDQVSTLNRITSASSFAYNVILMNFMLNIQTKKEFLI